MARIAPVAGPRAPLLLWLRLLNKLARRRLGVATENVYNRVNAPLVNAAQGFCAMPPPHRPGTGPLPAPAPGLVTAAGLAGPAAVALHPFVRQRTALLTSYRRDGRPVGTPVHVAVEAGRAYFRTWDATWKVKRLGRNPEVALAPSTARGRPTGPAIRAHARLLARDEAARAARALATKYPVLHGLLIPLLHRLRRYRTAHFELTPVEIVARPSPIAPPPPSTENGSGGTAR